MDERHGDVVSTFSLARSLARSLTHSSVDTRTEAVVGQGIRVFLRVLKLVHELLPHPHLVCLLRYMI
jgi:hypothetical protein